MRIFRFFFLFLVYSFFTGKAFSQHRLKGFLGVEGGESFAYILEFSDSSGFIKGHSYTRQSGKKEVKAGIEGTLDREARILRFRETELLYNHGFESRATICLIQATLTFVKEDGETVFKGPITTSDVTNVACSGGTVIMNNREEVAVLFETMGKADDKDSIPAAFRKGKPLKYVYDTTEVMQQVPAVSEKNLQVTEGKDALFYWGSDSVVLYLWDSGKIDGDVLSVWIEPENLIGQYVLVREKKRLSIPFPGQEMTIALRAENEGSEPPNTATVLLQDKAAQYSIFAYNVKGKAAKIKIIRK